jgi:hypothetical protein
MFLIRIAFWLGLIVLLLPTDPRQQEKLAATAAGAAQKAATFCDRNAAMCARGAEYWAVFKQKLEFGGKLAYDLALERVAKPAATETAAPATTAPPARTDKARGTLTPADMAPEWRGKTARSGS